MNKFEKIYVIDNSREADGPRERDYSIELSDQEHLQRLRPNTIINESPPIALNLEMPILEKAIKEGKKNAKSKSKSPKSKTKKNNSKSNKPAMASLEKKL
jgi:hypothetical protein